MKPQNNSEAKGLKEINEIFDALDVIAKSGGQVYKDKKIDMSDLPVLINIAVQGKTFLDAIQGFDAAVAEAKDLDAAEQLAIVNRLFAVAKKYEEGRTA